MGFQLQRSSRGKCYENGDPFSFFSGKGKSKNPTVTKGTQTQENKAEEADEAEEEPRNAVEC